MTQAVEEFNKKHSAADQLPEPLSEKIFPWAQQRVEGTLVDVPGGGAAIHQADSRGVYHLLTADDLGRRVKREPNGISFRDRDSIIRNFVQEDRHGKSTLPTPADDRIRNYGGEEWQGGQVFDQLKGADGAMLRHLDGEYVFVPPEKTREFQSQRSDRKYVRNVIEQLNKTRSVDAQFNLPKLEVEFGTYVPGNKVSATAKVLDVPMNGDAGMILGNIDAWHGGDASNRPAYLHREEDGSWKTVHEKPTDGALGVKLYDAGHGRVEIVQEKDRPAFDKAHDKDFERTVKTLVKAQGLSR